jgi:antitoxin component of RelBE/YafQ-DinJ toxin-antitoxin module
MHSEIVSRIGSWLPDFISLFLKKPIAKRSLPADVTESEALQRFERDLVREVIALMEGALRLAVTREEPCYDPAIISSNLSVVQELVELVALTKTRRLLTTNEEDGAKCIAVCE